MRIEKGMWIVYNIYKAETRKKKELICVLAALLKWKAEREYDEE